MIDTLFEALILLASGLTLASAFKAMDAAILLLTPPGDAESARRTFLQAVYFAAIALPSAAAYFTFAPGSVTLFRDGAPLSMTDAVACLLALVTAALLWGAYPWIVWRKRTRR